MMTPVETAIETTNLLFKELIFRRKNGTNFSICRLTNFLQYNLS